MNTMTMQYTSLLLFVVAGMLGIVGVAAPDTALAQTYPARTVRIIVGFEPGGSTDIIARALGKPLAEIWGQQVVIENRPGAVSQIGLLATAKAPPDGYTLGIAPASFSSNPTLYAGTIPYDAIADFVPITLINTTPLVLVTNADSQVRSIGELIAAAKAAPGKLNYGTAGGPNQLAGELLNVMAGIRIQHIIYKGNAPTLTDLMGGRLDMVIVGTTAVMPLITPGKLRPLAVTSRNRSSGLPQVPSVEETGLAGFESLAWNGLVAPAKTARSIILKINADAIKAINTPEMQQRLKADGSESGGNTPEQFAAFIREEMVKWEKIIRIAGIKP